MKKVLYFLLLVTVLSVFADPVSAELLKNPLGDATFVGVICGIAKYIGGLIAALATVMFVWAGILFVISAGNPGKIESAKKVAIYAIIGVAIALAGIGIVDLTAEIIGAEGGGGCGTSSMTGGPPAGG